MNIVFLCGSLEIGRDGVGDYTRRLASALVELNNSISIIALNDNFVSTVTESAGDNNNPYKTLRLPQALARKNKHLIVKNWVKESNPNWLSLQYVPYSFNRKGLPWWLPKYLSKITKGRKVHIMFHEVWVGVSNNSSLKHRVYGFFQKTIARSLVNNLQPRVMTTSNTLYWEILNKNGIRSEVLALFSNISKSKVNLRSRHDLLSKFSFLKSLKGDEIIIGIFGTLHPEANLEYTIKKELAEAREHDNELVFISFGKVGRFGLIELDRLKKVFDGSVKVHHLGEQSEEDISILFQVMNKGISCTPIEYIGKSGVFAAMRYHGLNVVCNSSVDMPEYTWVREHNRQLFKKDEDSWSVQAVSNQFNKLLLNN